MILILHHGMVVKMHLSCNWNIYSEHGLSIHSIISPRLETGLSNAEEECIFSPLFPYHYSFLLFRYAVDIVGSVIFGLEVDSFSKPDNEFRSLTDRVLNQSTILQKLMAIMNFACPPYVYSY